MNTVMVSSQDLLETRVTDYIPNAYNTAFLMNRQRPLLTQWVVRQMIVDPRVSFGLWLIKGPMLSKAKFAVESETEEVQTFVQKLINDFWLNGAVQALKAVEWGYSGSEVLYKRDEKTGQIHYAGLKDFDSTHVKIVTKNGVRAGILLDNFQTQRMSQGKAVYLGGPKCFHHVHWRHAHPYYGMSRLIGAHLPWNEIWCEGGYRDIRRLWFYQNAFNGGIMYHPEGSVKTPEGRILNYQDIAQEMVEKMRAGATLAMPSKFDQRGNRLWDYQSPKGNTIPSGLFDYGDSLRIEILEAMGIPYEVIEASGNEGFGSSTGRQIPETAFYAILQEELNWLIYDLVEQVAKPLVQINAALGLLPYDTFEVLAHPLDSEASDMVYDEEGGDPNNLSNSEEDTLKNPKSKKPIKKEPKPNESKNAIDKSEDQNEVKRLSVAG